MMLSTLTVLALQTAVAATPPKLDTSRPIMMNMDYPREALAAREEGRAVMTLTIDARGRVTGCTVIESTGSATLDAASCRTTRSLRYTPARDAGGRKVAGEAEHRLNWKLPG